MFLARATPLTANVATTTTANTTPIRLLIADPLSSAMTRQDDPFTNLYIPYYTIGEYPAGFELSWNWVWAWFESVGIGLDGLIRWNGGQTISKRWMCIVE